MTIPAYVVLIAAIVDGPKTDLHGYGLMFLGFMIVPFVVGHLTRGLTLLLEHRSQSLSLVRLCTSGGVLLACLLAYFLSKYLFVNPIIENFEKIQ